MSWVSGTITRDVRAGFTAIRQTQPRAVSKTRYLGSILSLTIGGCLFYVSAHYVGAFVHVGKSISLKTSVSVDHEIKDIHAKVAKIIGERKYKRVYLRAGQAIEAEYALSKGANLQLHIIQCAQAPIIEVFKCDTITERKLSINNKTIGSSKITVAQAGFYYFTESVSQDDSRLQAKGVDYAIHWKRA